jgi:hypothetical protein
MIATDELYLTLPLDWRMLPGIRLYPSTEWSRMISLQILLPEGFVD